MIHKIKKILEAKIEADSAYYSLIYTFAYRVELFSFLVISVLFFLSLFLNFKLNNDFFTLLSIFFLVTISNVLDFKYFKLKKILFYVFLYSGGLYFITHHFNFILWFYILLLAVAFLEYLTFSIAALIVILLTMYYKFETNQIDGKILAQGNIFALNNINFIYIFSIVGLVSIYIVNRFSLSFKEMIEENEQKNRELTKDKEKFELYNLQLLKEAEIRNEIQKSLESSRLRFKSIFDHANDALILEANKVALERYGFNLDSINNYNYYNLVSPEIKPLLEEREKTIVEEKTSIFESQHIDKNNNIIYDENKVSFIETPNFNFFVNVSKDISERIRKEKEYQDVEKQLRRMVLDRTAQLEDAMEELRSEIEDKIKTENELRITKDELEKSLEIEREYSHLKNRFVSMISHEYRTPLTVILSSIYILDHFFFAQDKDNFQKNLKKIQDTVQSMTNLLEDVIRIGKTENQFAQVSYNKYDIIKLIYEILTEIKFIEKIPHDYEFAKDYQGLIISSDEKLQSHIIRNLIHNASKYSEKGTLIKVNIYLLEDNLNIIISDQGIGIPEDDLKHLFEPFFRSGNVGAREGTGLGLSLTKRHVEALGGTIEVESVENQGTTFKLVFPVTYFEILNEENDKS